VGIDKKGRIWVERTKESFNRQTKELRLKCNLLIATHQPIGTVVCKTLA